MDIKIKKFKQENIKTWFVTGASSGVGFELCKQLLDKGYNVIAVARKIPEFQHRNALCLSVDVTKPDMIQEALRLGTERFERIDVLCNNAGVSSFVTIEETTLEHIQQVMDVNFWGAYNTIHEFLPYFRKNKSGTIINNTSMHGLSIRFGGGAYCASKYALEGLNSVCWHEARRFCRVMSFELGAFSTGILEHSVVKKTEIDEYKDIPDFYKNFDRWSYYNDLNIAIKTLIDQVEMKKLPRHLIIGKDAYNKIRIEAMSILNDLKYAKNYSLKCSVKKENLLFRIIKKVYKTIHSCKNQK